MGATARRPSQVAKQADDEPPRVKLVQRGDTLAVLRPVYVFRFLMDTGEVVDVESDNDDSDVRALVLKHTKAEQIRGSTRLACVGWTTSE